MSYRDDGYYSSRDGGHHHYSHHHPRQSSSRPLPTFSSPPGERYSDVSLNEGDEEWFQDVDPWRRSSGAAEGAGAGIRKEDDSSGSRRRRRRWQIALMFSTLALGGGILAASGYLWLGWFGGGPESSAAATTTAAWSSNNSSQSPEAMAALDRAAREGAKDAARAEREADRAAAQAALDREAAEAGAALALGTAATHTTTITTSTFSPPDRPSYSPPNYYPAQPYPPPAKGMEQPNAAAQEEAALASARDAASAAQAATEARAAAERAALAAASAAEAAAELAAEAAAEAVRIAVDRAMEDLAEEADAAVREALAEEAYERAMEEAEREAERGAAAIEAALAEESAFHAAQLAADAASSKEGAAEAAAAASAAAAAAAAWGDDRIPSEVRDPPASTSAAAFAANIFSEERINFQLQEQEAAEADEGSFSSASPIREGGYQHVSDDGMLSLMHADEATAGCDGRGGKGDVANVDLGTVEDWAEFFRGGDKCGSDCDCQSGCCGWHYRRVCVDPHTFRGPLGGDYPVSACMGDGTTARGGDDDEEEDEVPDLSAAAATKWPTGRATRRPTPRPTRSPTPRPTEGPTREIEVLWDPSERGDLSSWATMSVVEKLAASHLGYDGSSWDAGRTPAQAAVWYQCLTKEQMAAAAILGYGEPEWNDGAVPPRLLDCAVPPGAPVPTLRPTRSPTRRPPTRSPSSDEVVDVAIVGGGVAGLSAARSLTLGGVNDWVVLEGQARVGGRARSERWSGTTINTGAYYVSGTDNGNPFYEAIKRYGIKTRDIDYNSWTTYGEGEERWEDMEKGSDCLDETAHRMWEEFDATGRYQVATARRVLQECGWDMTSSMDRGIEWNYYDWEYGRTPDDLSVYASPAYSYHDFGSVQPLISDEGGIAKFLIGLLNDFVPPPHSADTRFRLNSPVNTILTHSTRCPTEAGPNCVELRLNGGKTIFAKHAILTASFGVLQRTHQTLLPQGFPGRDVLHKFTMGYFEKVYFRFRQRFWDDTDFILDSNAGKPVLMWHPNPHQQQSQEGVLQVTITGKDAKNFVGMDDTQKKMYMLSRLHEMYPGKFTLDDVVDTYFTNWVESPISYGAWFEHGPDSTPADYLRLIQPVGNLIIGGEMTCKRYYGYVHGAMVSGERDANRILAKLGRPAYDDRRCDS